jgi:fibronectin-binding autotransporter adhesin
MASWNLVYRARAVMAALSLAGFSSIASAAQLSDTWLGGTGSWTSSNWSVTTGLGYPKNGSPSGTTYTALIDNGNATVSDVSLSASVAVDNVSVSSGDTLEILSSGVLTIPTYAGAGTISNAGTIKLRVTGGANAPTLMIDGSGVASPMAALTGGGVVTMTSGSMISGALGTETLSSNNPISGAGTISGLNLVNHGTINANVSGVILSINPSSTVANAGTGAAGTGLLEATGGGILVFGGGTFDNTDPTFPGTISATGASSVVELSVASGAATTIRGGTLTTDGLGNIENFHITTLRDLTFSSGARFIQSDGATTNLQGTITNGGTITLLSLGMAATILQLNSGDAILNGTGSISLNGFTVSGNDPNLLKIQGVASGSVAPRLTIGAGQTMTGTGQIGSFSTTLTPKLTNHGTITASTLPPNQTPAGITVFPLSGADAFINDGTLAAADNNAVLTLSGGTVTNFSVSSLGTIVAHGHNLSGTLVFERGVTVNGGAILLDGPLSTLQLNSATASPVTVTNSTGGTITTIASSTSNTLGGAITNAGGSTIVAAANSALTVQPSGTGFVNSATLRAATGSVLNVVGGYSQTGGDTNVVGTLTVSGAPLVASGGTLSGGGTTNINAGLSLAGAVTKLDGGTVTIAGPENHSAGASLAVNGGRVKFNLATGTSVAVGSGVAVSVAAGATLELSGAVSALSAGANRAAITNASVAPGILVSGTHQQVGAISGAGSTGVNAGSDLTANHIIQRALIIGGAMGNPATVTIAVSNAAGNPIAEGAGDAGTRIGDGVSHFGDSIDSPVSASAYSTSIGEVNTFDVVQLTDGGTATTPLPVPEPSACLLFALAGAAFLVARRRTG